MDSGVFNIARFDPDKDSFDKSLPELKEHYEMFSMIRRAMIEAVDIMFRGLSASYMEYLEEEFIDSVQNIEDIDPQLIEKRVNEIFYFYSTRNKCGISCLNATKVISLDNMNNIEQLLLNIQDRLPLFVHKLFHYNVYGVLMFFKQKLKQRKYRYYNVRIEKPKYFPNDCHYIVLIYDIKKEYWYSFSPNNFFNPINNKELKQCMDELIYDENGNLFDRARSIIFAEDYEKIVELVTSVEGGIMPTLEELRRFECMFLEG